MSKADEIAVGGLVKAPGTSCDAAFVLTENGWRLRWKLTELDRVRDYGGCAQLGSGQLVPLDSVRIPEPKPE